MPGRSVKAAALAACLLAFGLPCGADVLLWMVDEPAVAAQSSGITISGLPYVDSEDFPEYQYLEAARVAVYKDGARVQDLVGGELVDRYLTVWDPRDSTQTGTSTSSDLSLVSREGETVWSTVNPIYADVSGYDASYSFMLEVGVFDGNDDDNWLVLAISQTESYQNLVTDGYVYTGDVPEHTPWTGLTANGGWMVPEPSSGLLLLVGAGLLALRRRRRVA